MEPQASSPSMQRRTRIAATASIARMPISMTLSAARITTPASARTAIGALLRRNARPLGRDTDTKSASSARASNPSAGPSRSSLSAGRSRTFSRSGPGMCRWRCAPRTRTPYRLPSGRSAMRSPALAFSGATTASTTTDSAAMSGPRLRPTRKPSVSLSVSNSDVVALRISVSPFLSSRFLMSDRQNSPPLRIPVIFSPPRLRAATSLTFLPSNSSVRSVASDRNWVSPVSASSPPDSRSGRRKRPSSVIRAIPVSAVTMPTGVISKIENGSSPLRRATPSTSRLVDVPMSVRVPPRMDA